MATTTNYSWNTPDNTAYVKDGASAIRTLGSSVDTTLFTALGGAYPGLRLIKKQTIGTAVSSVVVTGAFSATYDHYRIIVAGGAASVSNSISLQLGATTTGYYYSASGRTYANAALTFGGAPGSAFSFGEASASGINGIMDLFLPFASDETSYTAQAALFTTTGYQYTSGGFLNNSTSYTGFTILPTSGTLTGGTIYVYGYGAS
jgi:hypothetical protein